MVGMLAGVGASFVVCVALYWLYVECRPYRRARVAPDASKRDAALLAPLFLGKLRAAVAGDGTAVLAPLFVGKF